MTVAQRITALSTRIGNYIRDNIVPRLLPVVGSGSAGQVPTVGTGGAVAYADPFLKNGGTITTGFNVTGNGNFYNAANKFAVDIYSGATRFYSSGANTTTKGGFEFHGISSNGLLDNIHLSILGNGNVGFGTTNPQFLLDVNGAINTTSSLNLSGSAFAYFDGTWNRVCRRNTVPAFSIGNTSTYYDNTVHYFRIDSGVQVMQVDSSGIYTAYSIRLGGEIAMLNNKLLYWKDVAGNDRRFLGFSGSNFYVGDVDNTVTNSQNIFSANLAHIFYVNGSEVSSISAKGFLCPRMTTTQINAIVSPTKGLQVYNTTLDCMCVYTGSWQKMTTTAM